MPLPPVKLPPWDDKTKWQKAWDSGEAPSLPSEDCIVELDRTIGSPFTAGLQPAAAAIYRRRVVAVVCLAAGPGLAPAVALAGWAVMRYRLNDCMPCPMLVMPAMAMQ